MAVTSSNGDSCVYFVCLPRAGCVLAEGFFDKANQPTVTFHFTEPMGSRQNRITCTTDLKWQVFEEILKFPDIWLLVYAKSGYMTLPVDQLTPDCMQFIDTQITENSKA